MLMAVGLLGAILAVATPQPVEAACRGTSSYSHQYPSSDPWGRENSQWISTCDDDWQYWGKVQDAKADGSRVQIRAYVNDSYFYSNLSSDAWVPYHFTDYNGIADIQLQKISVYNGQLTGREPWADNWGF